MADLSTMRIFNDKDEEWCDLFEECHKEEWRREYYDDKYGIDADEYEIEEND